MNFFDNCKNLTVMVGGGSGVLFQPSGEKKYSYVLTAKHNLKDKLVIFKYDGTKLNIQKCYKHETLDIAIIKIEKTDSPEILIQKENPEYLSKYKLYGYPIKRRNETKKNDKIHDYDLELTSTSNENYNIDLRNADSSPYDEVVGFSGGGLFNAENTNDDKVYLAGIEYQLNNKGDEDEEETHNRIGFISIKAFDEIVDKYSNELVYLDDAKNFNKKYNVEETVIDLGDNKSIVLKTVPVEIDEVDSDGKNKKKILNVSIYPVTFEEYNNFRKINCHYTDNDKSEYPIVNINWNDAEAYCLWLGHKIHKKIRMLTSKEWNFLVKTIYNDKVSDYCTFSSKRLEKIDNISEDNLGLYNIIGNIKEWCWDGKDDKKHIKGLAFSDNLKKIDKLLKDNMVRKSTYKNNRGFRIVF